MKRNQSRFIEEFSNLESSVMKHPEDSRTLNLNPKVHLSVVLKRPSSPIKPKVTKTEEIFRQKIRNKRRDIKKMIMANLKVPLILIYFETN